MFHKEQFFWKESLKPTQSTLQYDLTKENKETISIDYRNSNYKHITISLPSLIDKDILLKQLYLW